LKKQRKLLKRVVVPSFDFPVGVYEAGIYWIANSLKTVDCSPTGIEFCNDTKWPEIVEGGISRQE
jgi:hypothetical protein